MAQPTPAICEAADAKQSCLRSAPDLACGLDDKLELAPLIILGELVAADRRGEAALRRQRQPLQRDIFRRLIDPALQRVLALQRRLLAGDETEDGHLVAGQMAQRLEAAGTVGVVFEEEALDVHRSERDLGDRLVAA